MTVTSWPRWGCQNPVPRRRAAADDEHVGVQLGHGVCGRAAGAVLSTTRSAKEASVPGARFWSMRSAIGAECASPLRSTTDRFCRATAHERRRSC